MLWTFKKFLIKALLVVAALFLAFNVLNLHKENQNKVEVIKQTEEVKSSTYIIDKEMVLGKLKMNPQIVSLEQKFSDKDTQVDDSWLGERHVELKVKGKFKLGINTSEIELKHIDLTNRIVYLKLGKPTLISLELPYNQVKFEKTQGFFRLALDEKERENFYIATEKSIRNEILHNKEIMKQANLFNQAVISGLLKEMGVKSVIFE
ncbi:hypothetical protein BAOM_2995 [Peribacillus asahii]|uniref:DUF4230 domain-containing protein n=1 Tax=Peribacillus asahii TaxID=228899 RepID=A0A3T0KTT7_9BACI|nr:DUF4230 domain-containing protein [Peribacillus asahii]AZV43604.1 hypothetical protein BAOM_2995 [Peribacillus asahii]